jgi:uncharacterized protein (DUF362 family)
MRRNRRRTICIFTILAVLVGASVAHSLAMPQHTSAGITRVAIARTDGGINAAVRQAVAQAGGLSQVIAPGDVVVVKPNLVMNAPVASGIVTDPAVVRAVVQMAREAGASHVIIAEGTAQYREGDLNRDRFCTREAFRVAGYDTDGDMVEDVTGAPLVDLNDSGGTDATDPEKVTRVVVPAGLMRNEYWLPNVVLGADVLISVPVFKNHYLAGITLGMKNLVGILPADLYHGPGNVYGKHSLSHNPVELDRHIVDLSLARRPDFVVVDGQRGMVDGPIGSQLIAPPMGLVRAGPDVVAVDTVGSLVAGYEPGSIPYLGLAAQSGLGTTDVGHIEVAGIPVAEARRDFPAPYADSPARRAEAQPPTVAFAAPKEGELEGTVTVTIEANDDHAMSRVDLYLDGQWIGRTLGSPYMFSVDTADYAEGVHTFHAVAYDSSLNQAASSLEVRFAARATALSATATPTDTPTTTSHTPGPKPADPTPTAVPLNTPTEPPATRTDAPLPTLSRATLTPTLTDTLAPTESAIPNVASSRGVIETPTSSPTGTTASASPKSETSNRTPTSSSAAARTAQTSEVEATDPPTSEHAAHYEEARRPVVSVLYVLVPLLAAGAAGVGLWLVVRTRRR